MASVASTSMRAWRTNSHRAADLVDVATGTERVEQCVGVKISLGHRGDLLCRALLGTRRGSLRWSATWWTPPNYTTSGDANEGAPRHPHENVPRRWRSRMASPQGRLPESGAIV